jgi:hypothetical protein
MTEKRFKLIDGIKKGTHSGIWDNQKQRNQGIGDELWLGEVVGMLNEGVILAEETTNLKEENEQLKQVLGNILLEVKRDITITNCTGEIKVFINPNSFNLISDVLRKYGALKEWYE